MAAITCGSDVLYFGQEKSRKSEGMLKSETYGDHGPRGNNCNKM